jgi:hypothetical protein
VAANRSVVLISRPLGNAQASDFDIADRPLPPLEEGQMLVQNLYLSIDPGVRNLLGAETGYLPPIGIGAALSGTVLGQVLETRNPQFGVGDLLIGRGTIGEFSLITPGPLCWKVDPARGATLASALGVLGVPGLTAYMGLLEVARPRTGETVLVSGAAGAVGSIAAQIARIKGCRVVGIAGGEAKRRLLLDEFGLDAAVDYKGLSVDKLSAAIATACPAGVDVLFDNVGGSVLDAALAQMNRGGRIAACGMISQYDGSPPPSLQNLFHIVSKSLRMEGFLLFDFVSHYDRAFAELTEWASQGKVHCRQDIADGLEQAIPMFLKLFDGGNRGKAIVRLQV